MVAPLSVANFRTCLERSGLLPREVLAPLWKEIQGRSDSPEALEILTDQLVEQRLLTPFQAKQIKRGRFDKFFLNEKYKLLDYLGGGGMGQVYLCEHLILHRLVAIKLLQIQETGDHAMRAAVERFYREARAIAALDDPNIVKVFDVDWIARKPFMVMEYVDGSSLHQIVTKNGVLSPTRAAHYIKQAAEGLNHAYQVGLIHRDIKPGNILVDRSGVVKILDLGLARFSHDQSRNQSLTARFDKNMVIGTVDFMAPEQTIDSSEVDIRSDIYSLGCTMYFTLTGRVPFPKGTVAEKMISHQTLAPEPLSELCPMLPEGMIEVIDRMIEKNREHRYQTPSEVAEALKPWIAEPISPPREEELPEHPASNYRLGLSSHSGISSAQMVTPNPSSSIDTLGDAHPAEDLLNDDQSCWSVLPNSGSIPSIVIEPARTLTVPPVSYRLWRTTAVLFALVILLLGGFIWWQSTQTEIKNPEPNLPIDLVENQKQEKKAEPFVGIILRGGGSTLVDPMMQHWSNVYTKLKRIKIDYQPVGSGKGTQGVIDRVYMFGCSDAPLTNYHISNAQEFGDELIHVPLVLGAIVPVYNLPEVSSQIKFTGPVLADIYMGKITQWNHDAIQLNNPGVKLPNLPITVIHRTEPSGSTFIWTSYLSKANPNWKERFGDPNTEVEWPVGERARGSQGMASQVSRTVGSIGYVENSFAIQYRLTLGQIENREGKYVKPTPESITAAANASLNKIPGDLRINITDAPGEDSYPIAGTTWAIIYQNQSKNPHAKELIEFLQWITHEGQLYVKDFKYAPLPPELIKHIDEKLSTVQLPKK